MPLHCCSTIVVHADQDHECTLPSALHALMALCWAHVTRCATIGYASGPMRALSLTSTCLSHCSNVLACCNINININVNTVKSTKNKNELMEPRTAAHDSRPKIREIFQADAAFSYSFRCFIPSLIILLEIAVTNTV